MKKKRPVKLTEVYTGVIAVDLPPEIHKKIARIARTDSTIETTIAVILALQFPMPSRPIHKGRNHDG